jgi:hypothetical protein
MTIRVLSCLLIAFATCAAPVSGAPVKKSESLNKAIEALTREYKQQVAKDGESTRERSNYFENEKPEDVTVDALLAALEAPIKGLDARGNAWVKWQLLSALTEPLEDKQQLKQFVAIYRKAPKPEKHPSLDNRRRSKLDKMVSGKGRDDQLLVRQEFAAINQQYVKENEFVLRYRNTLYSKLPVTLDTIKLGFEDAYERASVGMDVESITRLIDKTIRDYIGSEGAGSPRVREVQPIVEQVVKLHGAVVYNDVQLNDKDQLVWKSAPVSMDPRQTLAKLRNAFWPAQK